MAETESGVGCWGLDTGYWILDTGYWILDTGYWMDVEALPLFLLVLKLFIVYHANTTDILAEIFWLFLLNELTCAPN